MNQLESIIGNYTEFLFGIIGQVEAEGFDLADFTQLDHVCYRTTSVENYNTKKNQLKTVAQLLGESTVNGRSISTFRLTKPIIYKDWRIDTIELPAPKASSKYSEGLEHIEFVLYDDIPTFIKKYPNKPFEMRAADRCINPDISMQLGKYSVKFHLLSLATVIYLEHKLNIKEVKDGQ